jgi:3-oxoacyl-[acyl-carrier-protein] synthase-1
MARTPTTSTEDFVAVVTALGMVTPVGHTADESCASINAGLARIAESFELRVPDVKGHMVPATCGAVVGVTDGHRRFLRHYRLAVRALAEAIGRAEIGEPELVESGVYLCTCEPERMIIDSRIEHDLVRRLSVGIDVPDLTPRAQVFPLGHAAIFAALQAAVADLQTGRVRYAIVGGVDTYLDEATLDWLADIGRLKTDRNVNGIIPGEGAAFVVLEGRTAALARGAMPLARVDGAATATEPHGIYAGTPTRGDGLTNALERTLAALPMAGVDTAVVLCDLNGERYRATEWGLTFLRALGAVRRSPAVWHPATSTGDTGAAAGAINLAFGAAAVARGYAKPEQVLVWGSSDEGMRGSAYLRPADAA